MLDVPDSKKDESGLPSSKQQKKKWFRINKFYLNSNEIMLLSK
jgi:hypothetical protein